MAQIDRLIATNFLKTSKNIILDDGVKSEDGGGGGGGGGGEGVGGGGGEGSKLDLYLDMDSFDKLRYNTAKALSLTNDYKSK